MKNRHKYYNEIIAFAEGKAIQIRPEGLNAKWVDTENPQFMHEKVEYRVKPEPKYIPFTFEDRDELRGKWVRRKDTGDEMFIDRIDDRGVCSHYSYLRALAALEFLDGTPFGKLVEGGGEK